MNISTVPHIADYKIARIAGSACDTLTGIQEASIQLENSVKISPNPFIDNISLYFFEIKKGSATLIISNLLGKVILKRKIEMNSQELNLSFLSEGIYLLTIETKMESFTEKIVKME